MESLKFGKGKVIFAEGVLENFMFDIVSGSVDIYADYGKAAEKKLVTLKEGSIFGEMGMVENQPRSATAVAAERCELNKITADEFGEYFKGNPEKAMTVFRSTSHRMRTLTKDYLEVCSCIARYVKCKEDGTEPDKELMEKLRKIASIKK